MCRWMGVEGNETTLTAIEKFANQNYAYGREWLTSQVLEASIIIIIHKYRKSRCYNNIIFGQPGLCKNMSALLTMMR